MNASSLSAGGAGGHRWVRGLALLAAVWAAGALAQVVAVPAAHLNHAEGTVALSPPGDGEWHDVQPRRVLKRGDRLWTDPGARAELQAGGHAVRIDGQTQLVLENASDNATQLSLTQGSMALTVTRVTPGDTVEVGTPNLAFRARQPGDYRIDVDPRAGTTRVVVVSGAGVAYGEKGEALELRNGQRALFRARDLSRLPQGAFAAQDAFDRWAGARRRGEPTVSMPVAAQAEPAAPRSERVNTGPGLVIKGPAASLPGARTRTTQAAAAQMQIKGPPPQASAETLPASAPPVPARAAPAAPLRVTAPLAADAAARAPMANEARQQTTTPAETERPSHANAEARPRTEAPAQAARVQAKQKAQREPARRAEEHHRTALAARQAEEARRQQLVKKAAQAHQAAARQQQERHRLAARRTEERRLAAHRAEDQRLAARQREEDRAREQKRLASARAAEAQKLAQARQRQLARLQEQAARDEQRVREAQGRAQAQRRDELARKEEARLEEQARQEEAERRQRQLADQWRRDQERREQEVWLRQQRQQQQQQPLLPPRPAPMGVPARRVS